MWVKRHIPFPYKLIALPWAFARKLMKAVRLTFQDRNSGAAVWAGIVDFIFGVYGPPRQPRRPAQDSNFA
jgi:hypothetical protein